MKKIFLYSLLMSISSLTNSSDLTFNLPEPELNNIYEKKLWATFYHIWPAKEAQNGYPLLNNKNIAISSAVSAKDWCMGGIEGTIQIEAKDNTYKTYNYTDHNGAQQLDCSSILNIHKPWIKAVGKSRYQLAKGIYGDGVQNYKLIPYRTIAVDPKEIPYGSVIYIPQARGKIIKLPSGVEIKHDGFFYAADTGGAIKGRHIDIFSGVNLSNPFPEFVKSKSTFGFKAYLIKDDKTLQILKSLHE